MKSIITLAILLASYQFSAFAQENVFHLNGKLTGNAIDSVVISYSVASKQKINKTFPIDHGTFTATGEISYPVAANIYFKRKGEQLTRSQITERSIKVYLEATQMQLEGNPDEIGTLRLVGSKTQNENEEYKMLTEPVIREMKPLSEMYAKEKDHDKAAAIMAQFAPYNKRINAISYQYFLDHPHSFVTSDKLMFFISSLSLDSTKRVYNEMTPLQKSTPGGIYVANSLEKMQAGLPGKTAAGFEAKDINGKPLNLDSFKGKYVLLDFWASWCVPCRKGNPHLRDLYMKYREQGFDIVGIASDDPHPDAWRNAVEKDKIGVWHHILAGQSPAKDIGVNYGIHTLPTKILIDPQGKIIGRYGDSIGEKEEALDDKLKRIFKE